MGEVGMWYGHALKDADGKWLTASGDWTTDFARAAIHGAYPPVTARVSVFADDRVAVHAVRVKVTLEELKA